MALRMKKLAILSSIASLAPAVAFSQSCTVAQVSQEFSYEDTFSSSGSALADAYAVFQQDRFYVNQQGRLDPNDERDPIMVNREARANYGQAVRAYMNANGMGDMPAQVLVGSQYTVEIEACGLQDNPSIRVLSMRMGGDIEDDSWELELEYREAELAEWELEREYREAELADWEQRLNQREADLNQWERQLSDWERRLSNIQEDLEQSDAASPAAALNSTQSPQLDANPVANPSSQIVPSNLPRTATVPLSTGGVGENPLPVCWGYVEFMFSLRTDAEAASLLEHLDNNEVAVKSQWAVDNGSSMEDWDAGLFGGNFTAQSHARTEFSGIRQTMESCTNLIVLYMDYTAGQ